MSMRYFLNLYTFWSGDRRWIRHEIFLSTLPDGALRKVLLQVRDDVVVLADTGQGDSCVSIGILCLPSVFSIMLLRVVLSLP